MIKRLKLAFLFLIAGALFSGFYGSPANAGGSDRQRSSSSSPPAKLRTLTQPLPEGEEHGGSDTEARLSLDPVASTTPRGLPARGRRSALGTDRDPPANAGGSDNHVRAAGITDSDFAAHVEQLKKKLPSDDFTIVVQKPFVVIGDEPADDVKEHSVRTVKWAVDRLKQEYFSKDPKEILDIWLFRNKASYERNAQLLFGVRPTTPFGYYSSTQSPGDEHLDRRRHACS